MKQPYNPVDEDGNHILESLEAYQFEDPTLEYELAVQREGVQIHVKGRNPNDGAALLELLYLKTRHLPGYAQDPETYMFIAKEAELSRQKEHDNDTLTKHYKRVAAINKRKAIQAVRSGK